MTFLTKLLALSSVGLLAGAASAQIVATGQFSGQQSEGFETQPSQQFTTCIPNRVLNSTADLCDPQGNAIHITPSWGFFCTIFPHSGNKLCASAGGPAEWIFDQPASRFGGFWGTNSGTAGAVAEFYDSSNLLITSLPITAPADCSWTWNGWQVTGGPAIKRVKVIGNNPFGGSHIMMDDMEADYGPTCPLPTTYCVAKVNSLGCTPSISSTGTPSATAPSGFVVTAVNVRNQKAGLLFYGTSGPASTPFQGGTLCVKTPIRRTPVVNSGGTALPANDCTGVYSIDMNAFAQGSLGGTPDPALQVVGTNVNCQWWGRDPGFAAPNNTTLTDGLRYQVCP